MCGKLVIYYCEIKPDRVKQDLESPRRDSFCSNDRFDVDYSAYDMATY